MLDSRYSILDTGYSILDARFSILDSRYWILDAFAFAEATADKSAGKPSKKNGG
jgi:hypothetical protein